MRFLALFLLAVAVLATGPAQAATDLLDNVRPALIDIATLLILAAASWAAQRFSALTGIQIEARHREALQSALTNAAGIAVNAGVDTALGYVRRSVPDALAHFGVKTDGRIMELLEPHRVRLKAGS